jgi:hypothetical protein
MVKAVSAIAMFNTASRRLVLEIERRWTRAIWFAGALLATLEQGLGSIFTAEVKEAWTVAYTVLASTMQQGATAR